jgi:hypothetical protein
MNVLNMTALSGFKMAAFAAVLAFGFAGTTIGFGTEAQAQASCRQKCNSEEQACLGRTGNKSQCGTRAQSCAARCK